MSRFTEVSDAKIEDMIDEEDLTALYEYAYLTMNELRPIIERYCDNLTKEYSILEMSEEIVVCIQKCVTPGISICIGYPFPIAQKEISEFEIDGFRVNFHLRSGRLRKSQYFHYVRKVKQFYGNVEETVVQDKEVFRDLFQTCLGEKNKMNAMFFDYNRFIGDSIISLALVDNIMSLFPIEEMCVVSKNKKHIDCFYPALSYEDEEELRKQSEKCDILFLADFLDSHTGKTVKLLEEYKFNGVVVILSRNMFFSLKDGYAHAYKFDVPDILLTNQGIHRYLLETVESLIAIPKEGMSYGERRTRKAKDNVFINIFSSMVEKELSVNLVQEYISRLFESFTGTVFLSAGLNTAREQKVLSNVLEGLPKEYESRVEVIYDEGLSDLYNKLGNLEIGLGISADTSISHFLTKMGIKNFTVYMKGFWDEKSVLSMATESPLGYCSYNVNQMPVIYSLNKHKETVEALVFLSRYIINTDEKRLINRNLFFDSGFLDCYSSYKEKIAGARERDLIRYANHIYEVDELCINVLQQNKNSYLLQNIFLTCPVLKLLCEEI